MAAWFTVKLYLSVLILTSSRSRWIASTSRFILDNSGVGLLIPTGVWAQEKYLNDNTVLIALCDLPYDANDYIYDVQQLKKLKQENNDK